MHFERTMERSRGTLRSNDPVAAGSLRWRRSCTCPWGVAHRIATLVTVGFWAGCSAELPAEPQAADGSAIVNNTVVDSERPEVIALDVQKGAAVFVCTGTLVGDHTVITARHCVEGALDAKGCHIRALVDRSGESSVGASVETYSAVACMIMPPTFTYRSDLALVRLDRAVRGVSAARLADDSTPRGLYTAYGYGSFGRPLGVSCETPSDGHKRKAIYRGRLGLRLGQVTCKGDSGGPHFAGSSNVLAGVTSGGASGLGVTLDMNVDVQDTRSWIIDVMLSFADAPVE